MFTVRAPAERVWAYLVDPRQVVGCLAGAEITEVVDERTFHGHFKVKVGPVTAAYQGRVVLAEIDPNDLGVPLDLARRSLGDLFSLVQHEHLVRDAHHQRHIVLDNETRHALLSDAQDQFREVIRLMHV